MVAVSQDEMFADLLYKTCSTNAKQWACGKKVSWLWHQIPFRGKKSAIIPSPQERVINARQINIGETVCISKDCFSDKSRFIKLIKIPAIAARSGNDEIGILQNDAFQRQQLCPFVNFSSIASQIAVLADNTVAGNDLPRSNRVGKESVKLLLGGEGR